MKKLSKAEAIKYLDKMKLSYYVVDDDEEECCEHCSFYSADVRDYKDHQNQITFVVRLPSSCLRRIFAIGNDGFGEFPRMPPALWCGDFERCSESRESRIMLDEDLQYYWSMKHQNYRNQ